MDFNKLFKSHFTFADEEYELKFQHFLLNGILRLVVVLLSVLTLVRFYQDNYVQTLIDILFVFISIFVIYYIKKSKKHIYEITSLLLMAFFLLVSLSFINTNMYLIGASWFIVLLLPSYFLLGLKGGLSMTMASVVAILVLGQTIDNSYSITEYFYLLSTIFMASAFTYLYERKVIEINELLNLRNISLEKEVDIKSKEEIVLLQHNKELADLISKSNIELYIVDYESDHYVYVNQGGLNELGYTFQEMISMSVYDINPTLRVEMVESMKELSKTIKNTMNITQHKRKNGSSYGVQSLIHVSIYKGKKVYVIYDINLSDQQRAQDELLKQKDELLQQANHDILTKLPNRTLFNDRLKQAIAKSNRNEKEIAILFIDLDKFKEVNDTFGHKVGDSVLCEVSLRFKNLLRETDTIARLGGDEFVCIIEDLESSKKASVLAEKLILAIKEPMDIDGHTIILTCSIGISIYPKDADGTTELLHHADSAMYRVKDMGKDSYRFY